MKLKTELIIPYSMAVGIWNIVFTTIVTVFLSVCFSIPYSFKMFTESYLFGYVFLWFLYLHIIKQGGD